MNLNIESILNCVPEYHEFYNADELNEHSFHLARQYPDMVTIKILGYSKLEKPIYCLKIGNGSKTAVCYGTPHPNEPVGSMMLDALCTMLLQGKIFRLVSANQKPLTVRYSTMLFFK